jgi:ribonuclease J
MIHTGDFKFDQTPVDGLLFDVAKLARISDEGVLGLVSDTTNVERPGFVPSEQIVGDTFDRIIREAPGRVIIASFASQIHRMQMAVNSAKKHGRKVAAVGRSIQTNFEWASSNGYLSVPEGTRVRAEDIGSMRPTELVILTTGSQGEPLAGLARMANDDHRHVRIQENDTIVLSASPIPGNEDAVWRVVNRLIERGANVIHDSIMPVHVSGHGYSEELKLVLNIVNPRYAIPVHGEARMLRRYTVIAQEMGWRKEDTFHLAIGDVLELNETDGKVVDRIPSGAVLVDSSGSGAIHEVVLRDRQHLAEDGFVVVVVGLNRETGEIVSGPEILSRGFVYMDHSEDLINDAVAAVREYFSGFPAGSSREIDAVQSDLRQGLKKLFERRTGRRPLVLPMVMEL